MSLVVDLECDGFLESVSKIHCLVIKDTETSEVFQFVNSSAYQSIEDGLKKLMKGNTLILQNGIRFDIPVIQKLYPWFTIDESKVIDTLVLSRLIYSDLRDRDGAYIEKGMLPSKLWASHSLKAWGYRLGMLKGDYGDQENAWETFTPEMLEYCIGDVEITYKLYDHMMAAKYSQQAIDLEHKVAWVCARMERSGFPFNVQSASSLYAELVEIRAELLKEMTETFEPLVEERWSEKTGKKLKDKVTPFNPASRQQIAERLVKKYDWKAKEFTPSGQAKIDEDVLKNLPYPEAATLARFFLVEKRIGQIAEGDSAWLKLEKDGVIHGSINPLGAVTGRCTHQSPNLSQVPAVRSPYGKECRSLFTVKTGFKQVGVDLSGLELRVLAHFLAKWDDGAYGDVILNGDIHTVNQQAAGLETRDQAKTMIYALCYGAGTAKLGSIIGGGSKEGKQLQEKFFSSLPAFANLKNAVSKASKRGYLIGLDGRHLHVRSEHSALNTLLQSGGALISKAWLLEVDKAANKAGLQYGWDKDWTLLVYCHDELQFAVRDGLEEDFGKMVVECAARAGEYFNIKVPIGAEYKIGNNWADCH